MISMLQTLSTVYASSPTENRSVEENDNVIFLDFAKAFDTVPHHQLLLKLRNIGITGKLWLWLKEYLLGRVHCVSIDGVKSGLLPVTSGVPQGSILGPLFFLVYVNDLPDYVIHSKLLLFADDAKCLKRIACSEDIARLQEDLDSLNNWSLQWKLKFKESKCIHMRIGGESVDPSLYEINSVPIPTQSNNKDLGILISSDQTWSDHVRHITARAYKILGLLRRTFSSTNSIHEKKMLYISLVRSQLVYCSETWKPCYRKDIEKLEKVQRRSTKFILNDYEMDYKKRLTKLNLLPLMYMLDLRDIMFCVKSLKEPTADFNIREYISFSDQQTRSGLHKKMNITRSKKNICRNFYFNRIARIWNKLPPQDINRPLASIKQSMIKELTDHFISTYDPNNPCTLHFICPCAKCSHFPQPPLFN